MKIIIHQGTHEIGGSCVELISGNSRIIIDIGLPIVNSTGEKFDIKNYHNLTGPELINAKVLPDISGLYQWDKRDTIDGVLISHAHMDHYGLLGYVNLFGRGYETIDRLDGILYRFKCLDHQLPNL